MTFPIAGYYLDHLYLVPHCPPPLPLFAALGALGFERRLGYVSAIETSREQFIHSFSKCLSHAGKVPGTKQEQSRPGPNFHRAPTLGGWRWTFTAQSHKISYKDKPRLVLWDREEQDSLRVCNKPTSRPKTLAGSPTPIIWDPCLLSLPQGMVSENVGPKR